ncbi:MAG: arginine decarboxylase, partial [bacterium]
MINSNLTLIQTPSKYCLVAGKSEGFTKLNAFDGALLNAGVGNTNLVKMSSILPPNCEEVESFILPYGALVPVAYAATESAQENHLISSAVAIAIPKDSTLPGVIMEFSSSENAG